MSDRHPGYDSPAGPPMDALDRTLLDALDELLDSMSDDQLRYWLERRSQGYIRVADLVRYTAAKR